jgi:hypothetical protein
MKSDGASIFWPLEVAAREMSEIEQKRTYDARTVSALRIPLSL